MRSRCCTMCALSDASASSSSGAASAIHKTTSPAESNSAAWRNCARPSFPDGKPSSQINPPAENTRIVSGQHIGHSEA